MICWPRHVRLTATLCCALALVLVLSTLVPIATAGGNAPLVVGAEIVLKAPDTTLFDEGTVISAQDNLVFRIEQVDTGRVRVVSPDHQVRGWLLTEQIVPLAEATAYFTEALVNDPKSMDALWQRGRVWFYLKEYDRALASLDQAIRLEPDQGRFYLARALVNLQRERFDPAIEDCDKAIELGFSLTAAHAARARAWLAKNDAEKARGDLDQALKAIRVMPSAATRDSTDRKSEPAPSSTAHRGDADGADDQDERTDAVESKPGPSNPTDLKDLIETGTAALGKKEYDKALAAFNEAIRQDPRYAPAFVGRAQTWAKKHYRDRELADLGTAISLEPNNAAYRVARGDSWSAQGQHKRAMVDYDEALRMEPNDPAKWVSRGNEWRKHLHLDQAIADYTQAIQLNPRYAPAYVARGQTYKQRRAYDQAIREFTELVQVDPNNSEGHRALARILATCTIETVRDGQRAVSHATRACELTRWQDPDCLDTLAAASAEAGDFAAAVNWQTKAIRLVRQNVPSALLRAQDAGGRRGVGFDDRLAFYKSRKPTRE